MLSLTKEQKLGQHNSCVQTRATGEHERSKWMLKIKIERQRYPLACIFRRIETKPK